MLNASYFANGSAANVMDYKYICELNQYEMLKQVQQFPTNLFWMILIGVIMLVLYLYIIPLIKNEKLNTLLNDAALGFIVASNITALIFCYTLVFNPTSEEMKRNIIILIVSIIIILGLLFYFNWKRFKENIQILKEKFGGIKNGNDRNTEHNDKI